MFENLITGMITAEESAALGISLGVLLLIYIFIILFAIGLYVYSAFALMAIAHKTGTEPAWLAWIPLGNMVLVSKIAKMHWWPVLMIIPGFIFYMFGIFFLIFMNQQITGIILIILGVIPMLIFTIYSIIWSWKMFEAVQRPGWWSLIMIPFGIIYIIATFIKSEQLQIIGNIIYILGIILYLAIFGIAAWSNPRKGESPIISKKIGKTMKGR